MITGDWRFKGKIRVNTYDNIIAQEMHSNIYGEIEKVLNNHQGYFAVHLKRYDIGGKVNFDLEQGLAIFIKKSITVKECKDIPIYRSGYDLIRDDVKTVPRNLQYISFEANNKNYME